ncbi:MAG: sigma factor [Anaerolineales bacterium]
MGDQAAAEDVLQETFRRVWRSAASYQSQRGSFTGWLRPDIGAGFQPGAGRRADCHRDDLYLCRAAL